jgi:glucose/arabinose dehydrogenase
MGRRRIGAVAVVALALGLLVGSAHAAKRGFTQVVGGLASPVYVTSAPGDPTTLYVVEQPGSIKIVKNGAVAGTLLDIHERVKSGGEQGLLGLAFDPKYQTNHRFYVDYTDLGGDTRVVEFRSGQAPGAGRQLLFMDDPYENHNGGNLQFDRLGYLYLGMGDGGSGGDPENRAQNLKSRFGKLMRINPSRAGATWQIVGFGLRNPWRYSFDRANGNLWIGDVGQGNWEEVDFRRASRIGKLANYGWSRFEGNAVYDAGKPYTNKGDRVRPQQVYSHSLGCSITGGYVYRGSAVSSAKGRYYYGDYCSGTIWSFRTGPNGKAGAPRVEGKVDQLSSFGEDGNGELYATSLNGSLYRLR